MGNTKNKKLMGCSLCDREEEVDIEAKSVVCSICIMRGVSVPSSADIKEAKRKEKEEKKLAKKLAKAEGKTSPVADGEKKKRGRPRKNPIVETPKPTAENATSPQVSTDDPPKRKRGRPRKNPL